MSLRANETLEAFIDKIIRNNEIMDILKLPTILEEDSDEVKIQKRKKIIDKVIAKTAQETFELNKKFPPVTIYDKTYSDYGKIRLTISFTQSIKIDSYLFGKPQIDINIYYDNTETDNVFDLLSLISDLFSGQRIEIKTKEGKQVLKDIKCEVITSQVAIINNFERVGIRFSYYATLYKN